MDQILNRASAAVEPSLMEPWAKSLRFLHYDCGLELIVIAARLAICTKTAGRWLCKAEGRPKGTRPYTWHRRSLAALEASERYLMRQRRTPPADTPVAATAS
mgnify:CR=1 FL=1